MSTAAADRTIVLIRHAKAEQSMTKTDHDRELTERGRIDADAIGQWLRDEELVADLVLCSTAVRTRQTWAHAAEHGTGGAMVEFRKDIYLGGVGEVLRAVREDGGDSEVIFVVGHNPTMAMMASVLCDGEGSIEAHEALSGGLPTSGIAVLTYNGDWEDLAPDSARLLRVHVARG